MKKYLLTFFTIYLIVFNLNSQTWTWGKKFVTGDAEGSDVCTDASGNAYISGQFRNTLIAGSTTLTGNPGGNVYLAKYNTAGNPLWVTGSTGTNNGAIAWANASDPSGNIYITGYYGAGVFTLGAFSFTNTGSGSNQDLFLAKFDPSGNVLWLRSIAGAGNENAWDVCTDQAGNVFITGNFNDPSLIIGTSTLNCVSFSSEMVVKYDPNGNVLWARSGTGGSGDQGLSVCTDNAGNVYNSGSFGSPSSLAFGTYTLTSNMVGGANDAYLVKYDPNGNVLWATNVMSTSNEERGNSVCVDNAGNPYITGMKNGGAAFNNAQAYVSKYDKYGNLKWTRLSNSGPSNGQIGQSITSSNGMVFVGGSMGSSPFTMGSFTYTWVSTPWCCDPVFVIGYDSLGNQQFGTSVDKGGMDGFGIAADNACNIYVGSEFSGSFWVGPNNLVSSGIYNPYVGKLSYTCAPLGITETLNNNSSPVIYPNPVSDILHIDKAKKYSEIEIINCLGEIVLKQKYAESINVSELISGYYFIKFNNSYSKFIKE